MSRDETPDTTGLREAVEALLRTASRPTSDSATAQVNARALDRVHNIFAAHPTPDASLDPAVVTPDAGDVETLCVLFHDAYEAAATETGWETQERSRKPWAEVPEANKETMRATIRAVLASDWLANHVAAAREADRAEVELALRAEVYALSARLSLPACVCDEGPYFGAQMVGTPLRCERCGRDETQNPEERLAGLVAQIGALADQIEQGLAAGLGGDRSQTLANIATELHALIPAGAALDAVRDEAKACGKDAGSRPWWMSPVQYDPCPCVRPAGHDGDCGCADHDKPADAIARHTPEAT